MRSATCDRQRHWQSCFFVQGAGRIFGFVVDCIKNKLERIFPCLRIGKYWMNFFVQSKIMLLTLHLWDFVSHHLSSKKNQSMANFLLRNTVTLYWQLTGTHWTWGREADRKIEGTKQYRDGLFCLAMKSKRWTLVPAPITAIEDLVWTGHYTLLLSIISTNVHTVNLFAVRCTFHILLALRIWFSFKYCSLVSF